MTSKVSARDTVLGTNGSLIVTMSDGVSYKLAHILNFELDTDLGTKDITFPGSQSKSYRSGVREHSGSFTIAYMTSLFRTYIREEERNGTPFIFDIQVTNEDPVSKETIGKQILVCRDCTLTKYPQARFGGSDILEETYEFKAESIEYIETFKVHPLMNMQKR